MVGHNQSCTEHSLVNACLLRADAEATWRKWRRLVVVVAQRAGVPAQFVLVEALFHHLGAHHTELSNFALLRRPPSTMLSKLMSALASWSRRELVTETLPVSLSPSVSSCEPLLVPFLFFDFPCARADMLRRMDGDKLRFLLVLELGLEYG